MDRARLPNNPQNQWEIGTGTAGKPNPHIAFAGGVEDRSSRAPEPTGLPLFFWSPYILQQSYEPEELQELQVGVGIPIPQ